MLTRIRERATGWIAWAIVIFISIPFALWGVNSYLEGGSELIVAEVNGDEIGAVEYQQALYEERDRLRRQYGNDINPELLTGSVLGRQLVDRLVVDRLLIRSAEDYKYRISDQQLAEFIRSTPAFQIDEQFSQDRYARLLQMSGYSPSQFEEQQRSAATVQQLQNGFLLASLDLNTFTNQLLALNFQDRHGEFAIIDPSRFVSSIVVSESAIQNEYDENQSAYVEPARMKTNYVELKVSDLAIDFEPSEETLQLMYDSRAAEFFGDEQRSVSHILISVEDSEQAAESAARDVLTRLANGESFEDLARELSADSGSAEAGGSLGWINRGVTMPEFENMAFSLTEGEISEPVRSEFGYHVIRVDEIEESSLLPFEEVRSELIELAVREQAESEFFVLREDAANLAYEDPESLDSTARALGIPVQTSEWFSRQDGSGIAAHRNVREAAFSSQVLEDGFNSDVVEINVDHFVILRKTRYEDSHQLSLEEVRSEITEHLLAAQSVSAAETFGTDLVDSLKSGANWQATLNEYDLPTRDLSDAADENEVMVRMQSARKPFGGQSAYGGFALSDGRYVVYQLTEVVDGNPADVTDEQRDLFASVLNERFGAGVFSAYISELRNQSDIRVYNDAL